jgi:hypothetical protein
MLLLGLCNNTNEKNIKVSIKFKNIMQDFAGSVVKMEIQNKKLYEERKKRVSDAIALKKPDRVPISPKIGTYYARAYGISVYEIMKDIRNVEPGVVAFLNDFKPDYFRSPVLYPIDPLEQLESTFIKWPGPTHGLPLNSSFQILDDTYLEDDEFDEFVFDPTHFIITKLLPRKNKALKGFEKLYFRNPIEQSLLVDMSILAQPDVKESMMAAIRAGELTAKWLQGMRQISQKVVEMGFPLGPSFAQSCPFDMFADNIRGFVTTIVDMKERPEQLEEALEVMERICIERTISGARARNAEYVLIPLHAGSDEFMSREDYERFYWKGLRAMIMAIVNEGMVPFVFCEGKYNSRLDIISDVPKGKVVYLFESVDMIRAKKTVGQVACICGNLSTATLAFGTRQQTIDECKWLIDNCAYGGGFIMDCSIVLDNAKRENLEAMFETTLLYGKY